MHPSEDDLLALAAGIEHAAAGAPAADADHVRACAPCSLRVQVLQAWLQDMEVSAVAEADAAFPPARLAAQRAEIMRRLESTPSVRVLPFPAATPPPAASVLHPRRWVAAAAAAGLVVGLLTGRLLWEQGPDRTPDRVRAAAVATAPRPTDAPRIERALSHPADEVFLSEIELALQSPRIRELQAIDALTPRIRQ